MLYIISKVIILFTQLVNTNDSEMLNLGLFKF